MVEEGQKADGGDNDSDAEVGQLVILSWRPAFWAFIFLIFHPLAIRLAKRIKGSTSIFFGPKKLGKLPKLKIPILDLPH